MRKKILIVEDHPDFRATVRQYLEKNKVQAEIFEADSAEMGVTKASFIRPNIVLMDISLPNANGLDATRHIKSDHPECDVVVVTVFDVDIFRQRARGAGVTDFIGKNDLFEKLMPVIRRCLEKSVLKDKKEVSSF